jgi:AcrR family transcriptional regulator
MTPHPDKAARGRPKTLSRDAVTEAAMRAYWEDGVDRVSLSEVCRRAGVSKPGVYREFGSEDGLTKAALARYFDQTFVPLIDMLASDLPFQEKLSVLVKAMSSKPNESGSPTWCLLADMRNCTDVLGDATREQLEQFRRQTLQGYERMVAMAKANHEIGDQIPTRSAARYIEAQLINASFQQARGENASVVRDVLRLAFSVFN